MTGMLDFETLMVKAVLADFDESVVHGYFSMRYGTIPHVSIPDNSENNSRCAWYEVEASTICRCTGIKLPDGQYLYEFDLCEFEEPFLRGTVRMGYIDFDDFSSSWVMRVSADTSLKRALKECLRVRIVGNVILYKNDFARLQDHQERGTACPTQPR